MTLDVLEPLWLAMEADIRQAKTIDDVIDTHRCGGAPGGDACVYVC